ncbi:unnamed protein product [Musa textilis]
MHALLMVADISHVLTSQRLVQQFFIGFVSSHHIKLVESREKKSCSYLLRNMTFAILIWCFLLCCSWSQLLETLPLPNIKWICPTAPTRPVAVFGGFPSNAWFDVGDLSENGPEDNEGMDASAAHIANLLSAEPADIKLGVGGFSMGAATALYSATCCGYGKYGSGKLYPVNLSAVVGLSGWLPCARSLKNKLEISEDAARQTTSLPILLCHGKGISSYIDMQMNFIILHIKNASLFFFQDACFVFLVLAFYFHGIRDDVVLYKHGEKSSQVLKSVGFENVTFKTYNGLGHYTVPGEMDDVCKFLVTTLGLDGSYS